MGGVKLTLLLERQMMKIPKQEYTNEFRELAVKRHKEVGSVSGVAKELGLVEQTLRNWVKAAEAGKLNGPGAKPITPEQMELSRLRAENIRLKRECEIIKKATGAQCRVRSHDKYGEVRLDRRAAPRIWAG